MKGHTPSPWQVDAAYPSEVQTPEGLTIASCWHEHCDGATIIVTGINPCSLEESAANAHLIAAAPDLLEALKAIDAMPHYLAVAPEHMEGLRKRYERALALAEAAVAKAEGRT